MKNLFLLISVFLFIISCKEDDINSIPSIETVNSDLISQGGVILNGNITNLGTETILEYGFEVVVNLNSGYFETKYTKPLPASSGSFSLEIRQDLYANVQYSYVAYILTENNIYRGELLSFFSNGSSSPIMIECNPNVTHIGDEVTITGENFPTNIEDIELSFGNEIAEIVSLSENSLTFNVPRPQNENRNLRISTAFGNTVTETDLLDLHQPVINSVSENSAFFGETITLNGDHFNLNVDYTSAEIGGFDTQITSTSRNEVTLIIPEEVNYSNSVIRLYAQNSYIEYSDFNIAIPEFIDVPNQIYRGEYFEITLDRTSSTQNKFIINDTNEYFAEIIDDTTVRLYIPDGCHAYDDRFLTLKWEINDIVVSYDEALEIINPYYSVQCDTLDDLPFGEYDTFTVNNQGLIIGDIIGTDNRRYIYNFDSLTNSWINNGLIVTGNGSPQNFGYSTKFTYSAYTNKIYVLIGGGVQDNFVSIDLVTLETSQLTENLFASFYGTSFSYSNRIFYTDPFDENIRVYDIDTNSWSIATSVPYNISQQRNLYISSVVKDNYVYFGNGGLGAGFNDFWRLNLNTYQWEQLPNHPNPKKESSAYEFNGKLHFVSDNIYIYDIEQQSWSMMEKQGFPNAYLGRIDAIIHNSTPYLIRKSNSLNAYPELYKGDKVE